MRTKAASESKAATEILQSAGLAALPWLAHGFSTRNGGLSQLYGGQALNLGYTKHDSRTNVQKNRGMFLQQLGAVNKKGEAWPLATLRQIHSDLIHCIDGISEHPIAGDGLITDRPGLLIAVQTADCLPVIVVDTKKKAVGVFHAGWRGTVKRIVEKGVGEMRRWFGSKPRDLEAAIGPGIHKCCYEVGEEVRSKFQSQFPYANDLFHELRDSDVVHERYPLLFLTARAPGHSELPSKLFLDLVEANRRQLVSAGVPSKNISASDLCTACRSDLLFSYRAERGETGRMMAAVGIRP